MSYLILISSFEIPTSGFSLKLQALKRRVEDTSADCLKDLDTTACSCAGVKVHFGTSSAYPVGRSSEAGWCSVVKSGRVRVREPRITVLLEMNVVDLQVMMEVRMHVDQDENSLS